MKRSFSIALLAVGLVLASQQHASAWSKFNFGVGLNIGWEGGGNSVLFGMLKGAPGPGQGDGYYGGGGFGPGGHASNDAYPNSAYAGVNPYGQAMPQAAPMPQMPRADTQPVGYFTYPTYPYPTYPAYTNYYGNWYGY